MEAKKPPKNVKEKAGNGKKNRNVKKDCGRRKKVVEIKIIVGNVTPHSHRSCCCYSKVCPYKKERNLRESYLSKNLVRAKN